jgi:DNA-binding LacI/PurR family transcriptional regulator
MGREMADMLIRLIADGEAGDADSSAVLPTELVVRASS